MHSPRFEAIGLWQSLQQANLTSEHAIDISLGMSGFLFERLRSRCSMETAIITIKEIISAGKFYFLDIFCATVAIRLQALDGSSSVLAHLLTVRPRSGAAQDQHQQNEKENSPRPKCRILFFDRIASAAMNA